jgi:hypothetical protein
MIAEKSSYTYAEMCEVLQKWEDVKGIRFTAVDGRQLINMIRELNRLEVEADNVPTPAGTPEQGVFTHSITLKGEPDQPEQPKRTRRTKN